MREPQYGREPYEQALRILLAGTCGVNPTLVQRETGVTRQCVAKFMAGQVAPDRATVDALGLFVWRQINPHLLLCEDDRRAETVVGAPRRPARRPPDIDQSRGVHASLAACISALTEPAPDDAPIEA